MTAIIKQVFFFTLVGRS